VQGDPVHGADGLLAVAVEESHLGQREGGGHRLPPSAVSGSTRVTRTTAAAAPMRPSTISNTVAPMIGRDSRANGIDVEERAAPAARPTPIPMPADTTSRMIDWRRLSRSR